MREGRAGREIGFPACHLHISSREVRNAGGKCKNSAVQRGSDSPSHHLQLWDFIGDSSPCRNSVFASVKWEQTVPDSPGSWEARGDTARELVGQRQPTARKEATGRAGKPAGESPPEPSQVGPEGGPEVWDCWRGACPSFQTHILLHSQRYPQTPYLTPATWGEASPGQNGAPGPWPLGGEPGPRKFKSLLSSSSPPRANWSRPRNRYGPTFLPSTSTRHVVGSAHR